MTATSIKTKTLKEIAEWDAVLGLPISFFCDIPNIEHSEENRAEYEKAWWGTAIELRNEGH